MRNDDSPRLYVVRVNMRRGPAVKRVLVTSVFGDNASQLHRHSTTYGYGGHYNIVTPTIVRSRYLFCYRAVYPLVSRDKRSSRLRDSTPALHRFTHPTPFGS
jgi:hypothetical protein